MLLLTTPGPVRTTVLHLPLQEDVPLTNVTSEQMKMLVRWLKEHQKDSKLKEEEFFESDQVSSQDSWLSELCPDSQFQLMLAARFLCVRGLLDSLARVAAAGLEGRGRGEIQGRLGVVEDLTEGEIREIEGEDEWDVLTDKPTS